MSSAKTMLTSKLVSHTPAASIAAVVALQQISSALGRNLDAVRQNVHRVSSIGGYTKIYKIIAFSISLIFK